MIKKWLQQRLEPEKPEVDPAHELLKEARAKELDVAHSVDEMRALRKKNNFGPNFRIAMKEAPRWK